MKEYELNLLQQIRDGESAFYPEELGTRELTYTNFQPLIKALQNLEQMGLITFKSEGERMTGQNFHTIAYDCKLTAAGFAVLQHQI